MCSTCNGPADERAAVSPDARGTLTAYLHALVADGYRTSTIQRRLSSIAVRHKGAAGVATHVIQR